MAHSIFIETTIPSYYVARPSRDLLQLARQELTRNWWDARRHQFGLHTSQLVLDEAAMGEAIKASERLQLLDGIPLLDINERWPPKSSPAVFCVPSQDAMPSIWPRQASIVWIFS